MEIKAQISDKIIETFDQDGIDRRGFLKCMAWAGSGVSGP